MGLRASPAGRRAALRLWLLVLLLLGQPGGICAALCALGGRPAVAGVHRGHHAPPEPAGPCHRLGDASSRVHELLDAIVLALTLPASAPAAPVRPAERPVPLAAAPYPTFELIPEPPPPRA